MKFIVTYALRTMDNDLNYIEAALARLSPEQVWRKPRPSVNSIGNLCLHLAGTEYQRFSSMIGGKPLIRERSAEFSAEDGPSAAELIAKLREVREQSKQILPHLSDEQLDREIEVYFRPEDWQRMLAHQPDYNTHPAYKPQKISQIIFGVATHYSYHSGQIVMLAKLLQDSEEQILRFKH